MKERKPNFDFVEEIRKQGYSIYFSKEEVRKIKTYSGYLSWCREKNLPFIRVEKRRSLARVDLILRTVDYQLTLKEREDLLNVIASHVKMEREKVINKWEIILKEEEFLGLKVPFKSLEFLLERFFDLLKRASIRSENRETKPKGEEEKEFNEMLRRGATEEELWEMVLDLPRYYHVWTSYYRKLKKRHPLFPLDAPMENRTVLKRKV